METGLICILDWNFIGHVLEIGGYIPELSCHQYIHLDYMKELKFDF